MRVYLDDERDTPPGWVRVYWPDQAIALLETGAVSELSLDHDLGDDDRGTGYDVLTWIERAIVERDFAPPRLQVHSTNPAARQRMQAAPLAIARLREAGSLAPALARSAALGQRRPAPPLDFLARRTIVIPAKAGIQRPQSRFSMRLRTPAFAGKTTIRGPLDFDNPGRRMAADKRRRKRSTGPCLHAGRGPARSAAG